MTLAAFIPTGISLFCAGFLFGLYVRGGDARRIPEHPSMRRRTQRPTLRVIDGDYQRPYNWAEEQ